MLHPPKQMALPNREMQTTVINPNVTTVETELVKEAETVIETENEETAVETSSRGRRTAIKMELPQVIMAAHMEVQRVGAEAEAEMMIADTHDATETAQTKLAAETVIFTEVAAACDHGLGAQTETSIVRAIAEIAMILMLLQEKIAGTEMSVARAEVPSEKVHLP